MDSFARLLARHREAAGLSANDLGKRVGLTPSCVSRLETGARHPTAATVRSLATALALDTDATDTLLVAAGYCPAWVQAHWPWVVATRRAVEMGA